MIRDIIPNAVMWWAHQTFHPNPGPVMTGSEVSKLFKDVDNVFISDISYTTARKKDINHFLSYNMFNFRKYVPEKYDCDNYSFSLMGLFTNLMSGYAIGIVWADTPGGAHALNFFIDEKKVMWYIEPQTNKVFQNKDYKPYFIVL